MRDNIMKTHFLERYENYEREYDETSIKLPHSLNIELNNTCNQNCIFCPFHGKASSLALEKHIMDSETAKQILSEAYKLGIGKKEVGFYISGEPFAHPDLVDIISYSKGIGYEYVYLTSNGGIAFPTKIFDAVRAGLDSIRFSINAADREMYLRIHGRDDFDKVREGIISLSNFRKKNNLEFYISISSVITKLTGDIRKNMTDMFGEYVDDIIFVPAIPYNCFDEDIKKDVFLNQEHRFHADDNYICKALFDSMYINSNGEVLLCCESCTKGRFVVSKYGDAPLDEIWHMDMYAEYRERFAKHSSLKGTVCEDCIIRLTNGVPFFID